MLAQISQNKSNQLSPLIIGTLSEDYSSDDYKVGSEERDIQANKQQHDQYNKSQIAMAARDNPLIINKGLPHTRNRKSEMNLIKLNDQRKFSEEFQMVSIKLRTEGDKVAQPLRRDDTIIVTVKNAEDSSMDIPITNKIIMISNDGLSPLLNTQKAQKSKNRPVKELFEIIKDEIFKKGFSKSFFQSRGGSVSEHPNHHKHLTVQPIMIDSSQHQQIIEGASDNDCSGISNNFQNLNLPIYQSQMSRTQHQNDQFINIIDQTLIDQSSQDKSQITMSLTPQKNEKTSRLQVRRRKSLKAVFFKKEEPEICQRVGNDSQDMKEKSQKFVKSEKNPKSQKDSEPQTINLISNFDQSNIKNNSQTPIMQRQGSLSGKPSYHNRRSKLIRAASNDLTNQFIGVKKKKRQRGTKDKKFGQLKLEEVVQLKRVHSNFNESCIKLLNTGLERVESNLSAASFDSNGNRKSCITNEQRRSLRRDSLSGNKVRFNKDMIGDYNQIDEQAKIDENRRKYKKNYGSSQELLIVIQVQARPKKVTLVKGSDPIVAISYNKQFTQDKAQYKYFVINLQQFKLVAQLQKNEGILGSKLREYQFKLSKNAKRNSFNNKGNKNLQDMKNEIKQKSKKTIVFHLESTLLHIIIKKNELQGYDASAYVKLIGKSQLKLYLNYRPYLKEMLMELKQDYELILFGSKETQYIEQIGATLQKDEQIFDYLIPREMLYTHKDSGVQSLDLSILLGTRDLKDILVITHNLEKSFLHTANCIPIKEYTGCKKDLSFFSLTRYLKGYRDIIDRSMMLKLATSSQISDIQQKLQRMISLKLIAFKMLIDKSSQVVVADDGRPVQSYNLLKFSQSLFQKFKLEEVDNSREFEKKIDNAIIQLEKDIQEKKANIRKLMKEVTFNDDLIPSSKNRHSALVI
eukprot:403345696